MDNIGPQSAVMPARLSFANLLWALHYGFMIDADVTCLTAPPAGVPRNALLQTEHS